MTETVPATKEHARELARMMRPQDAAEVKRASGHEPLGGLLASLAKSSCANVFLINGKPAAVFGVAPADALEGVGFAWLLTTHEVDVHPLPFLRASKKELERLLNIWPVLRAVVDAKHARAMRWAQWLGFAADTSIFSDDAEFVLVTLRRH